MKSKEKNFNAINVLDDTYEQFNQELRKQVLAKAGHYVTQDEALKAIFEELRTLRAKEDGNL